MAAHTSEGFAGFPPTQWSELGRAGVGDLHALDHLLRRYLPALKTHLVLKRRLQPDRADDLLQSFVADKVLMGDLLARADREKGKFRTFLLTALERYLISALRHETAKKRSPGEGSLLELDEYADDARVESDAAEAFDRAWARQVIREVLRRMQAECEASGRNDLWGIFEQRVVAPVLDGAVVGSYDQLTAQYGFQSAVQASNALITAKRMFARVLRAVVAEYAKDQREVDQELVELRTILSRGGAG
jgi:DNA-directed RNA polymerase specialized sigma24 family protein